MAFSLILIGFQAHPTNCLNVLEKESGLWLGTIQSIQHMCVCARRPIKMHPVYPVVR